MEVFHLGYRIPFHHLPPMAWDPVEFPSYSLGSVKAEAFQEGMDKMLQKGILELVHQPSVGFYSRLFLVRKGTGGWRPVIDLSSLNRFVTLTKCTMETVSSVLGSIRKGDVMFLINSKMHIFRFLSIWSLTLTFGLLFRGSCTSFGLSSVLQVFTRVFALVLEWVYRSGIQLLRCLDDWLVVTESVPLLLQHLEQPRALLGPRDCRQLGEVRPRAVQQDLVSWNADRHHPREDLSGGLSDYQVLRSCKQVPSSLVSSCEDVATAFGPHGICSASFPGVMFGCAHFSGS